LNNNFFRWLPAVDEILEMKEIKEDSSLPRPLLVEVIRNVLSEYRDSLRQGTIQYENSHLLKKAVISDIISYIKKNARPVLQPVINATGVVLHTNLGRAVLSEAARCAVDMVASGYSNLEINLETGLRGSRYSHVEELLRKLTGAEDCIVVNNNAAAVLLALDTLAKGKETIVSRGELVEIGGAFRIPEVMERSGSKLVEVGTTNKTYVCDYEKAITDETGLLLKVHTSNYRVIGFTHQVKLHELAQLGQKNKIPVMEDLGSGCFYDLRITGIGDEPTVPQAVHTGADIITFSGDKLLGGPQAGIIVGKEKYISLMKKNPLNRALRIDKMTVAALEATLRSYLDPKEAAREIPVIEMLTRPLSALKEQAETMGKMLQSQLKDCLDIKVEAGVSQVGGGSLPTCELPTWLLLMRPKQHSVDYFAAALRRGNPAVLVYIREGLMVMDPRTVMPTQYKDLAEAMKQVCGGE
jgi:L-seryl-tRNA(Ser) seleniumtransferase